MLIFDNSNHFFMHIRYFYISFTEVLLMFFLNLILTAITFLGYSDPRVSQAFN